MKNILFLVFLLIGGTITAQSTYKVDAGHSSLVFSLGYNYSSFYGSFGEMQGEAVLADDNDFSTAQVSFTVVIASINTNSKGRDGHLQGERYLGGEKNPNATFKSNYIKSLGDNRYEMTGDLTIAGKTLSQTVLVEITGQGEVGQKDDKQSIMGVKASFSFNRSNFGITGGIPKIADKVDMVASLNMVKA